MFLWVLQMTIISIILIGSIHYIFLFFKQNLTIPKTKDLVNKPVENYKKMLNINNNKNTADDMKSELKEYIKNLVPSKNNTVESSQQNNHNDNTNDTNDTNKVNETGDFFNTQYSSY